MMALEHLDTKWARVNQPDPDSAQAGEVETEHILAPADGPAAPSRSGSASIPRPSSLACSKMSALPRSNALAISTGGSSRVRAGSLCESESRSHDGPSPPTATASRWTCVLSGRRCVEIQLESLQVPPGGGHRDISSQRSAACDARPRYGRLAEHPLVRRGCRSRARRISAGRARYSAASPGASLGKLSEPQNAPVC
jgi:hypothetical protein